MTATDRLRALLDERGVEYSGRTTSTSFGRLKFTQWGKQDDELDGVRWKCSADSRPGGGLLVLVHCDDFDDARDVVEATLGRGKCRNNAIRPQAFWCDQCDCAAEGWVDVGGTLINGFRYCPNCGKKVVEK